VLPITLRVSQKWNFCKTSFLFDMPAIHGGIEQKLALKSVQGGTLLRESLKAGLIFRAAQEQLYTVTETERRNPLKQV